MVVIVGGGGGGGRQGVGGGEGMPCHSPTPTDSSGAGQRAGVGRLLFNPGLCPPPLSIYGGRGREGGGRKGGGEEGGRGRGY